jgi:hypothetical protein
MTIAHAYTVVKMITSNFHARRCKALIELSKEFPSHAAAVRNVRNVKMFDTGTVVLLGTFQAARGHW